MTAAAVFPLVVLILADVRWIQAGLGWSFFSYVFASLLNQAFGVLIYGLLHVWPAWLAVLLISLLALMDMVRRPRRWWMAPGAVACVVAVAAALIHGDQQIRYRQPMSLFVQR